MLVTEENLTDRNTAPPAECTPRLASIDLEEWQDFVESRPDSMVFHHRQWIEAIAKQYRLGIHIPCLKSGGKIQSAIPFLSAQTLFGGTKLVSLPFTDYLRVLSCRHNAAEELTSMLMANHPPCDAMLMRTDTPLTSVPSSSHAVRHEVVLDGSLEVLEKRFKESVRRNIQRARRVGLSYAKRTDADAMEMFYRLHVLTRRKLGVPVQPKRFFRLLWRRVISAGLGHVGIVMKQGNPVAAGVFLTFNSTVTYKYAASQPAALNDRPNDWLVYSALRAAAGEGYRVFDFGTSARCHEGLRRFKRHWGATEVDVHTAQFVGREKRPVGESRVFQLTSRVIRYSPAIVCRCVGEVCYRFAV